MAIQVRCPNDQCGKMLSVRDDFAGKTGRCPTCGSTFTIPDPRSPAAVEVVPAGAEDYDDRPRRRRHQEDDYDDDGDRPRRRGRYDDDYDQPTRRPTTVGTIVCLCLGIVFLAGLGLITLFPMYTILHPQAKAGGVDEIHGMFKLTEGKTLLIASCSIGGLCLLGLILYLTVSEKVADVFLVIFGCLGAGMGMTALFWLLGFIWDIFAINSSSKTNSLRGRQEDLFQPGAGLWIGLGIAIAVIAVFSTFLAIRRRGIWLYLGEGLGLVAGILLVCLNVKPFDSGENGINHAKRFIDRYVPLIKNQEKLGIRKR